MLQETLTIFQLMDEIQKKEWIANLIDVLNCSPRAFNVLNHCLEKEKQFCEEKNIKLNKLNPQLN